MDIISHGLWGAGTFGRRSRKDFWVAFFFGVAPDLFSFGIFTFARFFNLFNEPGILPDFKNGPPPMESIPSYVNTLYNFTHSFIIFGVVFGIVWLIKRRPYLLMLSWPLHILFDIFTHSTKFFATPFLWPVTSYKYDGVSWAEPQIFIPNLVFLAILYLGWLIYRKQNKKISL